MYGDGVPVLQLIMVGTKVVAMLCTILINRYDDSPAALPIYALC